MKTLKEIKDALLSVPDDVLDACGFGCGEGAEGEIRLVCEETVQIDGEDLSFSEVFEKYPVLTEFDNLIDNVKKADEKVKRDDEEGESISDKYWEDRVSSDDFGKKKKKSK